MVSSASRRLATLAPLLALLVSGCAFDASGLVASAPDARPADRLLPDLRADRPDDRDGGTDRDTGESPDALDLANGSDVLDGDAPLDAPDLADPPDGPPTDGPDGLDGDLVDAPLDQVGPDGPDVIVPRLRVTSGLVALYEFEEGAGTTVNDTSGVAPALDLTIAPIAAVAWQAHALRVNSEARIASAGGAQKVAQACRTSGEFTVELWLNPASLAQPNSQARVLSISSDVNNRNVEILQPTTSWVGRVSSSATGAADVTGLAATLLTHLVLIRRADGTLELRLDGFRLGNGFVGGDLSTWQDDYPLSLANHAISSRPWLGDLHLLAIYCRALSDAEVAQNLLAGADPL